MPMPGMLKRAGRRVVRGIPRAATRAVIGGTIAGPAGAAAGVAAPMVGRAARNVAQGASMARAGMKSTAAKTTAMHANSRFRNNRAIGAMARHPFMTGLGAYSVGSTYYSMPGSHRSRRNQRDPYLRRIREHQRSTALSGVMSHSTGGYA